LRRPKDQKLSLLSQFDSGEVKSYLRLQFGTNLTFPLDRINFFKSLQNILLFKNFYFSNFKNNFKVFLKNFKIENLGTWNLNRPYLFLNSNVSIKYTTPGFKLIKNLLIKRNKIKFQKWPIRKLKNKISKKIKFYVSPNLSKNQPMFFRLNNDYSSNLLSRKSTYKSIVKLYLPTIKKLKFNNSFFKLRKNSLRKITKKKLFKKFCKTFFLKNSKYILDFDFNNFKVTDPKLPTLGGLVVSYKENKLNLFYSNFLNYNSGDLGKCFQTNKLILKTKTQKNFIFKNTGLFLYTNSSFFSKKYFQYKYSFKKILFSFLFPNQIKKNLMNRKRRILISRFFSKFKKYSPKNFRFSLLLLKKNFKLFYTKNLLNTSFFGKSLLNSDFISYSNSNLNFYKNSSDEILYKDSYSLRGSDTSFKLKEVHISRIRFKPGYQRIWRNARTAVKESLGLKFRYQYTLTRYLTKFFRQTNTFSFSQSEMTLSRVVMYSRLLPDYTTFLNFFNNNLVYLNGNLSKNSNEVIVKSDFIQLIVSKWYYVVYRWLSNWTNLRIKKFKRLVYRKGLASKHKLMKTRKQRSSYTPLWIHNVRYDINDIKPYLEVDYFTLSAFVLYDPFFLNYSTPNDLPDSRLNIYKLYNWKYIN